MTLQILDIKKAAVKRLFFFKGKITSLRQQQVQRLERLEQRQVQQYQQLEQQEQLEQLLQQA